MQPPHSNYPQYPQQPRPPVPLPVVDRSADRAFAAVAHGAVAFGLLGIGFVVSLGITGILWLYSRRSTHVRFHAEQAGCYQCIVILVNIAFVMVLGLAGGLVVFQVAQGRSEFGLSWGLTAGLILWAAWFFGSIAYGIIAAILVLMGKPFKYPVIGDWFGKPGRLS